MSIVNISVERTRALVATDTRAKAQPPNEPAHWIDVAKLASFKREQVVLANRGNLGVFLQFVARMRGLAHEWDIHWIAANGPALAEEVRRSVLEHAGITGLHQFPTVLEGSEIFVVGWSQPFGEMLAFCLESGAYGRYTMQRVHTWCAAPHARDVWPTLDDVPALDTPAKMTAAAREQVRYFRSQFPDDAIGGRLIVAEITPIGITEYDAGAIEA